MKKFAVLLVFFGILGCYAGQASADDTEIYGGSTSAYQPNVLIIFDTSGSMNDEANLGDPYDPSITYPITNSCEGDNKPCVTNTVYRKVGFGVEGKWVNHIDDVESISDSCAAKNALKTEGAFIGYLSSTGTCPNKMSVLGSYRLGNYLNWEQSTGANLSKLEVAKEVVTDLINTTQGVKFGVMRFNNNQPGGLLTDSTYGSTYTAEVKDMDAIFTGTTTNREALVTAIDNISAADWTPLGETLFEAMRYFSGGSSAFNLGSYTSPIQASCQKNYVILITDGMSTQDKDVVLKTICSNGDCDGDGFEEANDPDKQPYESNGSDYLDDVAWYLYNTDLIDDSIMTGKQNVVTYTVGFGLGGADAGAVKLLSETAKNGKGKDYLASNTAALANSLNEIISSLLEDNTSFVAPVVPVSPENRTFSSSNVFIGFFRPAQNAFWAGNIKKYGLNTYGQLVDNDMTTLSTDANGAFYDTSTSFWGSSPDGGKVEAGGVGKVLLDRDFSVSPRNLYTYKTTVTPPITAYTTDLTDSSNAFDKTNISPEMLGYLATETSKRDKLVDYIVGYDAYGPDPTFKRDWIVGDILHSRPLVVNYAKFSENEMDDCIKNKTVIFVGTNGGMLHAFRDCDGKELWGFIPPDLLTKLDQLTGTTHPYFVDGSPKAYVYDFDNDGDIEPGSGLTEGDKVILVFGERRGGSTYYALDVSDFNNPVFLWSASPTQVCNGTSCTASTTYEELGQTWSEPVIGTIKVGGVKKIAFFVGGGNDETTEDTLPLLSTTNTKGRALFAIELAQPDGSGKLNDTSYIGAKIWEYSYTTSVTNDSTSSFDDMTYSIVSEPTLIDFDGNDFMDTVYIGDLGGQMWRFDIGNDDTAYWTGEIIFKSNPSTTEGRRIYYPPDIIQEFDPYNGNQVYNLLYFGTGDRAHPKNETIDGSDPGTALIDRMYLVKDRPKNFDGSTTSFPLDENNLVDVTTDALQLTSSSDSDIATILDNLSKKYGWLIKLDDTINFPGEKVLAPATVFNKVAYFSTFSPTSTTTDPCIPSAGTARIYAVNYLTGEAVFNFDTTNDSGYASETNTRATTEDNKVVKRSDRVKTLGSGIPSGVVIVISDTGPSSLIGVGGAMGTTELKPGGDIKQIFWKEGN